MLKPFVHWCQDYTPEAYNGDTGMKPAIFLALSIGFNVGAQSVTVPLILEGNAPIVEVLVRHGDHARTARFLVDTGGGALMIGSNVMSDLAVPPAGPEIKEGGDLLVPLRNLTCDIGGLQLDLKDVRIFGTPGRVRIMARNLVEGMVPASILRKYRVILNYPSRLFTLATSKSQPRGIQLDTPIAATSGFPRIEVEISGKKYGFLLDTGASFTMVSQSVLDGWTEQHPEWSTARGSTGFANMFGGAMENAGLMLRVPEMKIGKFSQRDAAVVSRPPGTFEKWMSSMMSAPIIGALAGNVLRDFRVEIDYPHGATYLERSQESRDTDLISVGLVLSIAENGDPIVTGMSSRAAEIVKHLVHTNDRLIAVGGRKVNGEPLAVIAGLLSGKEDTSVTLTILRGDEQVNLTLPAKRLL